MSFNINIDNTELEIISGRLKHTVTPLDNVKWLGNFEKQEIDLAKKILANLSVYIRDRKHIKRRFFKFISSKRAAKPLFNR